MTAYQRQDASNGSTAIQAGGNVQYGLTYTEVTSLMQMLMDANFPKLREEARRTAEESVREFAVTLQNKLLENEKSIDPQKFAEPDVQATLNDAVMATARKGSAANPEILSSLISERISTGSYDYKNIVLTAAVQVVPKLTKQHIALLTFVHFITKMNFEGLTDLSQLESVSKSALDLSKDGFDLSESQKLYLQSTGCCFYNTLIGGNIYEAVAAKYKNLGATDEKAFKYLLAFKAPSFLKLLDQFSKENLIQLQLLSPGHAIALANFSNSFGKLDFSIWLN